MIVLNEIDGIIIRILIGAAGSFIGGHGVVLFVKLVLNKGMVFTELADSVSKMTRIISLATRLKS